MHFEKKFKVRKVGPKYMYNALWIFFSKCVDLVPNLTHFEFFFKVCNFFQSALPHSNTLKQMFKQLQTNRIFLKQKYSLSLWGLEKAKYYDQTVWYGHARHIHVFLDSKDSLTVLTFTRPIFQSIPKCGLLWNEYALHRWRFSVSCVRTLRYCWGQLSDPLLS